MTPDDSNSESVPEWNRNTGRLLSWLTGRKSLSEGSSPAAGTSARLLSWITGRKADPRS